MNGCILIHNTQKVCDFGGTVTEASLEAFRIRLITTGAQLVLMAQCLQVTHGQLENVGFFEFGNIFTFLLVEKNMREKKWKLINC